MTDITIARTSTEVLEHECTTLAAQIAATTCRFLLVIGELDARDAWRGWGCRSMAHWLQWRCSLSRQAANDHVRVARALRSLPVMEAAFACGELSFSKVRALTKVATVESEAELVALGRTATAAQLERIVRATVVALADPAKREVMRELYLDVDADGFGIVHARLSGDEQATVCAAIDAGMSSAEDVPVATRRAEALVRVCESYLAHGDAARLGADRHAVVVHVEVDDDGTVERAETERGVPVHPVTVERLRCDATLFTIVHGRLEPVGSGRTTRTPSRALRRAIRRRSGGRCEWVGCTERTYVELHHVVPWSQGGATEWSNLVALCWHHHHLVHEGGWRLAFDAARSTIRCYRPDGTELLDPVPIAATSMPALGLVDEAIVPRWAGERFDLSAAVDAVLSQVDDRDAIMSG